MNRPVIWTPVWNNDVTSRGERLKPKPNVFSYPPMSVKEKRRHTLLCYMDKALRTYHIKQQYNSYDTTSIKDNNSINNQSVRERFELNKNRSATASRIIGDTLAAGLIKTTDEDMTSKKFASYIPFYG